jgi:hypothetical protein
VLSATVGPEEYAERIISLLTHHYEYGREKMLGVAAKKSTPEQRRALSAAAARHPARRLGGARP